MVFARTGSAVRDACIGLLCAVLLLLAFPVTVRAADYSCGTYGASTYGDNVCAATTTGGLLENTGQLALALTIPALMILVGTLLLFRTRRKMRARQLPPTP